MDMSGDKRKKDRPDRPVFDFLWKSAVGAIVGIVALIILRKYS